MGLNLFKLGSLSPDVEAAAKDLDALFVRLQKFLGDARVEAQKDTVSARAFLAQEDLAGAEALLLDLGAKVTDLVAKLK